MDLDKVLDEVGACGRYQIVMVFLISLPLIYSPMFALNWIFTPLKIDQRCLIEGCDQDNPTYDSPWLNNTIKFEEDKHKPSQCWRYESVEHGNSPNSTNNDTCPAEWFDPQKQVKCEKYVFKEPDVTLATEWINICDDESKLHLIGTVRNVGQFIGNAITGIIQDKIGRRGGLVLVIIVSSFMGIIKSFSVNYAMFLTFELVDAIFASGIYSAGFILGMEMVGPRNRILCGMLFASFYSLGEVFLGVQAMLIRHWRHLLLVIYVPPLIFISYLWLLPESVRWLSSKGRLEEAKKVLRKMAEINKVAINEEQLTTMAAEPTGSLLVVFKSKILVIRYLVTGTCWFTCSLVFFGLGLNAVHIGGNSYTDFIYVAMIEIPSIFTTFFLLRWTGRKILMVVSLALTGVFCISSIIVPIDLWWGNLLIFLAGKFFITIAYTVLFLYTAEMFPTPQRGLMVGLSEVISRIATIIAPQTPALMVYGHWVPLFCFGIVTLVAAAFSFILPETRNSNLPDTVEEAENIGKKPPRPTAES